MSGTHIRGVFRYDPAEPEVGLIEVTCWPVPRALEEKLLSAAKAAIVQLLLEHGISDGNETDLTAKGSMQ